MAEFLGQRKPKRIEMGKDQGFDAMGKPIPNLRKMAADDHLKDMGVTDAEDRFSCIASVSNRLEHDDPYAALGAAMVYLDFTGAYRLMAVLLTDPT